MIRRRFVFEKNSKNEWWLILPDWKGDPEDLQMIEGADQWLDLLSNNAKQIALEMSDEIFNDAAVLTLLRTREENFGGGGIYYLETYQSQQVNLKLWFCEVTKFIFDALPQKIYFTKT